MDIEDKAKGTSKLNNNKLIQNRCIEFSNNKYSNKFKILNSNHSRCPENSPPKINKYTK